MHLRLSIYNLIVKLTINTPLNTPNRIQFIHVEVEKFIRSQQITNENFVVIDCLKNVYSEYDGTVECLASILRVIVRKDVALPVHDIVLLPAASFCCGSKLRLDPRYSTVAIFTRNEKLSCRYFHSTCRTCKTSYYYNYCELNGVRSFEKVEEQEYFVIASGVGFSRKLLDEVSLQVTICSNGFDKIAEMYNMKNGLVEGACCQSRTLEECWIIYRIVMIKKQISWYRKKDSFKFDAEAICQNAYEDVRDEIDNKWVAHICDKPGCKERYIVIDGNEKLYRYCCGAPFERISGEKGDFLLCVDLI